MSATGGGDVDGVDGALAVTGEQKIHCAGCEERISNALRRLSGVQEVRASAETQRIVVRIDSTRVTADRVQAKLEWLGYRVQPESDRHDGGPLRTRDEGGPNAVAPEGGTP